MTGVRVSVEGSGDLIKMRNEAVALMNGRAFEPHGAGHDRLLRFILVEEAHFRRQPPERAPGSGPFVWSNDPEANARARRWFFRHFKNGYKRTGKMARLWVVSVDVRRGRLVLDAGNKAEGASFVYGDEERAQVPGHIETGWFNAADALLDFGVRAETFFADETDRILEAALR